MIPYIENNKKGIIGGLIKEGDLFFKEKENERGSSLYKKLILDEKHRYRLKDGEVQYGLKETGKWWHEDDFAVKFVNPRNKVIHIIEDKNWISETFIPNVGWKKGFEAVEARNSSNQPKLLKKLMEVFSLTGEVEEVEIEDFLEVKGKWKKIVSSKGEHLFFFIYGTETDEDYTCGGFDGPEDGNHFFVSESDFEATISDAFFEEGTFDEFEDEDFYTLYNQIIKGVQNA